MKKTILILLVAFVAVFSSMAQAVNSSPHTDHGRWEFAGQKISVQDFGDTAWNKTVTTSWVYRDTVTHQVTAKDDFTHSDTAFNTFWNSYNGFCFLYQELATKEGLPSGNCSAMEAMFYNKHIGRPSFAPPIVHH